MNLHLEYMYNYIFHNEQENVTFWWVRLYAVVYNMGIFIIYFVFIKGLFQVSFQLFFWERKTPPYQNATYLFQRYF